MGSTAGWSTPATSTGCKPCGKGRTVSGYQIAENAGPPTLLRRYDSPNAPRETNSSTPWNGVDILGGGNRSTYHPGRSASVTNVDEAGARSTVNITTEAGEALSYAAWLAKYKCYALAAGSLPPCNQVPATMP